MAADTVHCEGKGISGKAASARQRDRWPGKVPAGKVENGIISGLIGPTLGALATRTSLPN
jgi:hypothetical protein